MYPRYVSLIAFFIYFQVFVHFLTTTQICLVELTQSIYQVSMSPFFLRKNLAYYMNKSIAIEKKNLKLGFFGP